MYLFTIITSVRVSEHRNNNLEDQFYFFVIILEKESSMLYLKQGK